MKLFATPHSSDSVTFPRGFLDFLHVSEGRRHRVGDLELEPERLAVFNNALRELSPDAPAMTLDQIASAGERALARHADGSTPPFIASRIAAFERLQRMAEDAAWGMAPTLRRRVDVVRAYREREDDLIPDGEPVIGLLDDAVLVDVALQLLHDELADYEDFCRFRRVAADFAGVPEDEVGLSRAHWLEAMLQAHASLSHVDSPRRARYVPDPRASLFHIV
jgi:hypothetical protein